MAWPIGRLWRVCRVGVGVGCTVCRRAMALYMRIGMACYGVVWVRCVGVGYTYGVRCVCVVWCTLCVRCVYVVCIVL